MSITTPAVGRVVLAALMLIGCFLFSKSAPSRVEVSLARTSAPIAQPADPPASLSIGGGQIAFLCGNKLCLASIACNGSLEGCDHRLDYLADYADTRHAPSWSPDGTRIAFVSFGDIEHEGKVYPIPQVYAIDSDGSDERRLVEMPSQNAHPKWSPDGRHIGFVRWGRGVYLVNPNSGELNALIDTGPCDRCSFFPLALSWSPDGTHLAVGVFSRGGHTCVYNLDTNNQTAPPDLSALANWSSFPTWSPNNKHIAFVCNTEGSSNSDICTVDPHTGEEARLTSDPPAEMNPAWSPDGSRLAFESNRDGNWEIYVMDVDGGHQTNLTRHPAEDTKPAWTPDGTLIAFQSCRDDPSVEEKRLYCNSEIYVLNTDGSVQVRLTHSSLDDTLPVWAPE